MISTGHVALISDIACQVLFFTIHYLCTVLWQIYHTFRGGFIMTVAVVECKDRYDVMLVNYCIIYIGCFGAVSVYIYCMIYSRY